jgi:hypothetical protein
MQSVMIKSFLRQFATLEELAQKAGRSEANSGERSQFWGVLGQLLALLSDGKRSGVLDALVGTDASDKKLEDARKLLEETKREIEARTAEKGEKPNDSPAKEAPAAEKKSDIPSVKSSGNKQDSAAVKRADAKALPTTTPAPDLAAMLQQLTTELAENRKNQEELGKAFAALAARVDGPAHPAPPEVAPEAVPTSKRAAARKKVRR